MNEFVGLWIWRGVITAVILLLAFIYQRGWQTSPHPSSWRSRIPFFTSLTLLFIAVVSPLHQLASDTFFARTAQHLLLIAWIPALMMASNPFSILAEQIGGMVVWILGGIVFAWTAVYLARQWLTTEDNKPTLPTVLWDTEEVMIAPGLKK